MIAHLLDWAHKSIKSDLKTREMGDYLSNKLNVFFWKKCMKNVKAFVRIESHAKCLKKIKKRKGIVKYIRSNSWFERYQADIVELDKK